MQTFTCLIADDNLLERDALEMHLSKIPELQIEGICSDGVEVITTLKNKKIDIVFSDIDMPNLGGLSLLRTLKQPPVFVFITSHPEYAVESFELDVVDFLVKPVSFERILKSANKAIEYVSLKKLLEKEKKDSIESITPQKNVKEDYIFIRENHALVKIHLKDIAYIESMGDFSKIYLLNNNRHITLVNLKTIEQQLTSASFLRIHKQYLINYQTITAIVGDDLVLSQTIKVPIGPSYKNMLHDLVVAKNLISRFSE
jgi:DNA-binding LytR/AlgR family response regulator